MPAGMGAHAGMSSINELEYLCVDRFLAQFMDVQALASALELGIVDRLEQQAVEFGSLLPGADVRVLRLLVDLLRVNGVVEEGSYGVALTAEFRCALKFRGLIEAKIDFANLAAVDLIRHFSALVRDPREFMASAAMFRLFSYGRCFDFTPENIQLTRRWMRITTELTRHEARACLHRYDFTPHRRMLDIGGNSGEFALQICRQHAHLRATVFDLPLVCDIGREHIQSAPESARIAFVAGNAMEDALPAGMDLITFKSVLHDWPDAEAALFVRRAFAALAPGGTLLIFERGAFEIGATTLPYATVPLVTFAHSYRSPAFYEALLGELGGEKIATQRVGLEMPFFVCTAGKRAQ